MMRATWILAFVALVGCRTAEFRVQVDPSPVPRDPRTGRAHFTWIVDSRSRVRVRVGADGPWLEPGGRATAPGDLAPGEHEARLAFLAQDGRVHRTLAVDVPTVATRIEEEDLPLPDLGGWPVQVTAGYHAPNHRTPGRRRALDLVPQVPRGVPVLGTIVRSPFAGAVIGASAGRPDRPGGRANELVVRADDGRLYLFSHFAKDTVVLRPGERFSKGTVLGRIGLSGETSGAHLHMELLGPSQAR